MKSLIVLIILLSSSVYAQEDTVMTVSRANTSIAKLNTRIDSTTKYYNSTGRINKPQKIWIDKFIPTNAETTIDISSAGFTSIRGVTVTPIKNFVSVITTPFAYVKSYSTTSITYILFVPKVAVLGIEPFALLSNFSGIEVLVEVKGD